jgi:hypothetical protein
MEGWIKLYRKLTEKSFYRKDSEAVHLWIHILFSANHKEQQETLGGKRIICQPGQFTTGRKQLSKDTGINESKVFRLLQKFEKIECQIEQQTTNTNTLITVLNWNDYQMSEQQMNNERTTNEQQMNTLKEVKNIKNERSIFIRPNLIEISDYCNERKNTVKPEKFFDHYESNGWIVGKTKMKDWKAAIRTWEKNNFDHSNIKPQITVDQSMYEKQTKW